MIKKFTIIALALYTALSSFAFEKEFTYNTDGQEYSVYGYEKKEVYDVAMKISDPTLVGAKITGLYVPIPAKNEWITNCSGWLTKQLALENKKNKPDITSQVASFNDELLEVTFSEPYTITEEGVFVGYSFQVVELGEYSNLPVACIECATPDGLWMHTSRSRLKWMNIGQGELLNVASAMVVKLSIDVEGNNVALSLPANSFAKRGDDFNITARLVNLGIEPVEKIGYSWTAGPYTGSRELTLQKPVSTGADNVAEVEIPFDAIDAQGVYDMSVTINTVNGNQIANKERESQTSLVVMSVIPVKRPLVEEFTGLNCSFCPRGYVAMEQMGDKHGDLFVGMAYHSTSYESTSQMPVIEDYDFPIDVGGFPSGTIDRVVEMDPGYFISQWPNYASEIPEAAVEIEVTEPDDSGVITATSTLSFIKSYTDADYSVSFTVVADGLKNDKWKQSNAYAGKDIEGDYWDLFTKAGSRVAGLTFNDVVVYAKDVKGIAGSVPAVIKATEPITYQWSMNTNDIVNLSGAHFLNPEAKLRVVLALIDNKSGHVVNSISSRYLETSGVNLLGADRKEAISTECYDLIGNRIDNSSKGLRIERTINADGTVTVTKKLKR